MINQKTLFDSLSIIISIIAINIASGQFLLSQAYAGNDNHVIDQSILSQSASCSSDDEEYEQLMIYDSKDQKASLSLSIMKIIRPFFKLRVKKLKFHCGTYLWDGDEGALFIYIDDNLVKSYKVLMSVRCNKYDYCAATGSLLLPYPIIIDDIELGEHKLLIVEQRCRAKIVRYDDKIKINSNKSSLCLDILISKYFDHDNNSSINTLKHKNEYYFRRCDEWK